MNTDRDLVLELLKGRRLPAPLASSPLARELAGEILGLDAEHGEAMLAFTPPGRFAQGAGLLQGGIVAALLDFAMAFAAHAKLAAEERDFATASIHIHFMRPAPPERYLARGRIVRAGRRLLFAEAEIAADGASPSDRPAAPGRGAAGAAIIATASAILAIA